MQWFGKGVDCRMRRACDLRCWEPSVQRGGSEHGRVLVKTCGSQSADGRSGRPLTHTESLCIGLKLLQGGRFRQLLDEL